MKRIFLAICCVFSLSAYGESAMTQDQMERIVKQLADSAAGEKGVVEFVFQGMNMYLVSDASHDRMRIIAPIAEYSKLTQAQIKNAMESNFHSALDARYALSKDVLYAAYIHPLSKLDQSQIESAVTQVFNLRATFGGTYSSGVLSYKGN